MKNRLIALLLAVVLVSCLGACKKDSNDIKSTEETAVKATEAAEVYSPGVEQNNFDAGDFEDPAEGTEASAEKDTKDTDETEETKASAGSEKEEPEQTQASSDGKSDKPQETTAPSEPMSPADPTVSSGDAEDTVTYEEYLAMSADEQQEFYNTFESMGAFVNWFNAAKDAYEEANPPIEIGDGSVDMGDIIGGNG